MAYTGDSIVDYLKSVGQDSSMTARKKLAEELGISNYSGSSSQNTQMLNTLRSGSSTSNNNNSNSSKTDSVADVATDKVVDTKAEETKSDIPLGVSEDLWAKTDGNFEASDDVKEWDDKKSDALSNLGALTSKEDIISDSVMNSLNSSFTVPSEVVKADKWLAEQLEVIQSGKTSYSDQVRDMIDQIMNREKFSYDVDTDPLFQQALASAMNSGKQAMQDTIGQASALTGGYGSTYATSVGNQQYNAFIEDAYDNLPQYYQLALEAYQAEGDEMYRQYSMLSTEDEKEFNRNVTAYDATYQHRNRVYDEAYTQYRDNKSDAFAMANLQLNEHGQRVSDAYNYYGAVSDYSDTLYEREYNSWLDSVNMVWKKIETLTTDAWNDKNFDEGVRQHEDNKVFQSSEAEKNRAWQSAEAEKDRAFTASENAKNRAASKSSGGGGGGSSTGTYKFTNAEVKEIEKRYLEARESGKSEKDAVASVNAYLSSIGKGYQSVEQEAVVAELLIPVENSYLDSKKSTGSWVIDFAKKVIGGK